MRTIETLTEARAAIKEIDRAIDDNRSTLWSRCGRRPRTARTCQIAWDAHPDLRQRDHNLFWLRGEFQRVRDRLEYRQSLAAERAEARHYRGRKTKCPTCGTVSFATAA